MSKRVVGYVRVSTDRQAESGLGLDDQINKIKTYCSLYDLNLIDIIVDAGASAKDLEREGIQKLISEAQAGAFAGVVVAKLDRLTRSMRDLHTLLEQVFNSVELHSVAEKVDTSSAAGRLVLNVLMSVAEWEREAIGERTAAALKVKADRGEALGKAPFGRRWEGGQLVDDEREQEIISCVKELRARGWTLHAIKDELALRRMTGRTNRAPALSTIAKIGADASPTTQEPQREPRRLSGVGKAPFGRRWEGGQLIDDEREQGIIACVKELRARGWTLHAIKDELALRRMTGRTGASFSFATLSKIGAVA